MLRKKEMEPDTYLNFDLGDFEIQDNATKLPLITDNNYKHRNTALWKKIYSQIWIVSYLQ